MVAVAAFGAALWATTIATPAHAQLKSDGFVFLEAVEERNGDVVTEALNEPGKGDVLVNTRDRRSGDTALHIVTRRRDALWITFLTSKGGNPNIANREGLTPIQIAANLGFIDGVEALLKGGARADVTNNSGETPLIAAVHRRDTALVKVLMANGANADHNDNSGRSARDYAQLQGARNQLLAEMDAADEARKEAGNGKTYGPSF